MERCKNCKDFLFEWEKHFCKKFIVTDEDGYDEEIYAKDEEDAAERYAREYNENGDYELMDTSIIIKIDGHEYEIGAEASVDYRVRKI